MSGVFLYIRLSINFLGVHVILMTIAGIILIVLNIVLTKHKSLYPLLPYRYNFKKRRSTFRRALRLMSKTNAKTLIETGTARHGLDGVKSNGAATIVFGTWAKKHNAKLHSVDISEQSIQNSYNEVKSQRLETAVELCLSDSITFLEQFNNKVDFLYLDSYDYSSDPVVQEKSQDHHLKEFQAIEYRLHKNTIVLVDDCKLPGGGKGKKLIAYMLDRNWCIDMDKYQVLLLRNDFSLSDNYDY